MTPVNHLAVLNRSALDDVHIALIVEAYRPELPKFAAAWSLPAPGIAIYPRSHEGKPDDEAALIFVDSGGNPDAFGAHTALGLSRWGYVDVGLCKADGEPVDRVFGHELFELVADPDVDRWMGPMPDGSHYAVEVCDPVQRSSRSVEVELFNRTRAVQIANYVTPSWFDPFAGPGAGPLDALRLLERSLEVMDGGYQVRERNGVVLAAGDRARVTSHGRTFRRLVAGRAK